MRERVNEFREKVRLNEPVSSTFSENVECESKNSRKSFGIERERNKTQKSK
jgi:hypothetical protein